MSPSLRFFEEPIDVYLPKVFLGGDVSTVSKGIISFWSPFLRAIMYLGRLAVKPSSASPERQARIPTSRTSPTCQRQWLCHSLYAYFEDLKTIQLSFSRQGDKVFNASHDSCGLLQVYLVTELLLGGELLDAVLERGSYSESDARMCFAQLLSGIQYLHSKSVPLLPLPRSPLERPCFLPTPLFSPGWSRYHLDMTLRHVSNNNLYRGSHSSAIPFLHLSWLALLTTVVQTTMTQTGLLAVLPYHAILALAAVQQRMYVDLSPLPRRIHSRVWQSTLAISIAIAY